MDAVVYSSTTGRVVLKCFVEARGMHVRVGFFVRVVLRLGE